MVAAVGILVAMFDWLYAGGSRQDRLRDPARIIDALVVRPGDRVADLGPGDGQLTIRLAVAVAPDGIVYAADVDDRALEAVRRDAEAQGLTNLVTARVARDRLTLPEPVDLIFVSATYHHLPDRVAYFAAARALLRTGGRVVILEARAEGLLARWMGMHATSPRRITDEMGRAGYALSAPPDSELVHGYWLGAFQVVG